MFRIVCVYVWVVDGFNCGFGCIIMWGVFVMVGILLWLLIFKIFFNFLFWILEIVQFVMVVYYVFGGLYLIQMGFNVCMDLFYVEWSIEKKVWFDVFIVLLLIFYFCVLFYGVFGLMVYFFGFFGSDFFVFYFDFFKVFVIGGLQVVGEVMGYIECSLMVW